MRIALVANTTWYLVNYRLGTLRRLRELGHDVVALSPPDAERVARLGRAGVEHAPIVLGGSGTRLRDEQAALRDLYRVLRRGRFDLVFTFTPKANIYGGIACALLGVPMVANVSGLGRAFSERSWLSRAVTVGYRLAVRRARHIFFQNPEDLRDFAAAGIVDPARSSLLPGSGVDLRRFEPGEPPTGPFEFLLLARLLWDKGIAEFVEAARRIRSDRPDVVFRLLGPLEADAARAPSERQILDWVDEGVLVYDGMSEDVRPHLRAASCVVLPSYYREGTPRSLLEAAATARPIIATDMRGCREVVRDGVNGLLCSPRNVDSLTGCMRTMLEMPPERRRQMGLAGRTAMERGFDEAVVIQRYVDIVESIGGAPPVSPRAPSDPDPRAAVPGSAPSD